MLNFNRSVSLAKTIEQRILELDSFKDFSLNGTNRLALSEEEMKARAYLMNWMKELGMDVNVDAVGNIFGCFQGTDPSAAPVWTGSHIDTVKEAGMFDGVAGIVAGLEAVRLISEMEERSRRSIYVNVYTCEESTVYGVGAIGSRALAGHLKENELTKLKDLEGRTLYDQLVHRGFYHEETKKHLFGRAYLKPKASVELHIEQGPWLWEKHKTIGIVDHICAPTNLTIVLKGVQSHAGGTSMKDRKDAFAALAEISVEFEKIVSNGESAYSTGTIGYVNVSPNAVNVIPGEVQFSIDIRDCNRESKEHITERVLSKMREIAEKRGIEIEIEENSRDNPMTCDAEIGKMIENICIEKKLSYMHMISGAYHDSMFLGELSPVAMIFVPSRDGISHSPNEWTSYEQIAQGTKLLKEVLLKLAME